MANTFYLRVNTHKEYTYFHQFEKFERNKLVRAEIKVRKSVLGNSKVNALTLSDNCLYLESSQFSLHY